MNDTTGAGSADISDDIYTAQQDEMKSMAAIFADDFASISQTSFSIKLCTSDEFGRDNIGRMQSLDILNRPPEDLALVVRYPPDYPDSSIPIFELSYDTSQYTLHELQIREIIKVVSDVATTEIDMPCVYSCVNAAKEFLISGGLSQAGLALLPDDSLTNILTYVATSKEVIDDVSLALPVFDNAAKNNDVWKHLCNIKWIEKWGFEDRWRRALELYEEQPHEHYWMQRYEFEEEDAKRQYLTRDELCSMKFDRRIWFDAVSFRNQPDNMRDVMPTGLKRFLARDLVFSDNGDICSASSSSFNNWFIWQLLNEDTEGKITCIGLKHPNVDKIDKILISRMTNWGWEMRSSVGIWRAVDEKWDMEKPWEDLISNIIVQEKPEWIKDTRRAPYPYSFREIPDDEDCKMLAW